MGTPDELHAHLERLSERTIEALDDRLGDVRATLVTIQDSQRLISTTVEDLQRRIAHVEACQGALVEESESGIRARKPSVGTPTWLLVATAIFVPIVTAYLNSQ